MELKDVILSTLAEMEDITPKQTKPFERKEIKEIIPKEIKVVETPVVSIKEEKKQEKPEELSNHSVEGEVVYLNSIRERLLVLFEGFQAPNNTNIEAKVDLTLNFLEYMLATIDSRVEKLEKGNK